MVRQIYFLVFAFLLMSLCKEILELSLQLATRYTTVNHIGLLAQGLMLAVQGVFTYVFLRRYLTETTVDVPISASEAMLHGIRLTGVVIIIWSVPGFFDQVVKVFWDTYLTGQVSGSRATSLIVPMFSIVFGILLLRHPGRIYRWVEALRSPRDPVLP